MLTEVFQCGEIFGKVKRTSEDRHAFDRQLYLVALGKVYPDVRISVSNLRAEQTGDGVSVDVEGVGVASFAGMSIYAKMNAFADIAADISELNGADFDWPGPRGKVDVVGQAFEFYIDAPDVFGAAAEARDRLAFPNGKANAPKDKLTAKEQADPNS